MGQSKSKHVYAFQPLPWPEALTAFRLIDQVCGIASTYATTHLDKHATLVLDKVSELQRLPYVWDAFENDFERLRGTHLVRLAAELHTALDRLEGCKYDMGFLAEKGLTFKSQRKAADKVLLLLREVEEAHRAFHYAFELALYASLREHPENVDEGGGIRAPDEPPVAVDSAAAGNRGRGAGASSGGGTAVVGLRRAQIEAAANDPTSPPPPVPPPPAAEDSWMHDTRDLRASSSDRTADSARRRPAASGGEVTPASSPRALAAPAPAAAPVREAAAAPLPPQRPRTADASTMVRSEPPAAAPAAAPSAQSRPRSSSTRLTSSPAASAAQSTRRTRYGSERISRKDNADQQYVVMYMPQGPDGTGPRAILVPAEALQPAPSSPGPPPSAPATTVTGGLSPFAADPRTAYAALPPPPIPLHMAAAPSQAWAGPYVTTARSSPARPTSPPLPYQQQLFWQQQLQPQTTDFSYNPSPPLAATVPLPPPPPAPTSPLMSHRSPSATYRPAHRSPARAGAATRLTASYSAGSARTPYSTSPYNTSAFVRAVTSPPTPFRYFSQSPGHAPPPSLHHHTASSAFGKYGTSSSPPYGTSGNNFPHSSSSWRSPTLSMAASGIPDLNVYFNKPVLNSNSNSGGWISPLAAAVAAPTGAVSAVVPGAAPGSIMMLQPLSAHATSTGALVLQPQSSPSQPPMLVVAAPSPGGSGDGSDGASPGRVRFLGRRSDGDDIDDNIDDFARNSGGTNDSHHTYSYGPDRRRARPLFSPPYTGGDSLEKAYDLPDAYESYNDRRMSRRYSDCSGVGGARNRGSRDRRSAGEMDMAASRPPLMGLLSREADVEISGAGGFASRSPDRSGAAPAAALSYERLAALAGLDPEVLGGGTAAGLAARHSSSHPRSQTQTHHNNNHHNNHHRSNQQQPQHHFVPEESSLRRAELLSEAMEGGDWAAAVELAGLVRGGGGGGGWWGDARDGAVARGLLLQAALRGGSADAHAALGHMAERGEGLPGGKPDLAAAVRHYSAAAAGGHRDATTAFAYLLEHGLGVEQDEARAAQLYAAAAQRDCPTAANNLAKMILDGRGAVATATAMAAATSGGATGAGGATADDAAASATAFAKTLFRRAAKAGSASASYNLGVCHLQQLKQRGGGGGPLAATLREDVELEALRCFAEAARRGHARAALRAGYLHLQRSAAAAAVEAFCTAALNAGLQARAAAAPADAVDALPAGPATTAASAIGAEALWSLAQLAERQAAVLEVRTAAAGVAAGAAAAAPAVARSMSSRQSGASGEDAGGGSLRRQLSGRSNVSGEVDAARELRSRHSGDRGEGDGDGARVARPAVDDGVSSSSRTGGTENRAVGRLLATLAGSSNVTGADGGAAIAAAAAAAGGGGGGTGLDDPAASAAVQFAKEVCRLDFSCCHRPTGQMPFTAADGDAKLPPAAAAAAPLPIRGLRRLCRQAREVLTEATAPSGTAADAAAMSGSFSGTSSVESGAAISGGGAAAGTMAAALARLELELQQPAERARSARRAAAELMAAAAALGHAAAQHWLAGWRWSMGQSAAAMALWEAAGRRGHGASLMVLGQIAEAGQLSVAADGGTALAGGGGGSGADLAAAARYYLRAQEVGTPGAVEAMRRVQKLLQRHVTLQGKLEAVACTTGLAATTSFRGALGRRP